MRRSMLLDTSTIRAGSILLAAFLVGSCGLMDTSRSEPAAPEPAAPVSRSDEICDYICHAVIDTPSGTIAIGMAWNEGATLNEGYMAAWVVRDGRSRKKVLTYDEDVGGWMLTEWGDGAIIIATREGAGGGGLSWVTRDGKSWKGPTPFRLPGESVFSLRPGFVWDARIVITGEQCIDDRWVSSVWSSTDAVTWNLADSPGEGADFTGVRPGGDGLVVGRQINAVPSGSSHQEWEWTTADLVKWRPLGSPYPCCQDIEPWGPRYGCSQWASP